MLGIAWHIDGVGEDRKLGQQTTSETGTWGINLPWCSQEHHEVRRSREVTAYYQISLTYRTAIVGYANIQHHITQASTTSHF